jgi:predicted RNA-binding protein with TRAM domain
VNRGDVYKVQLTLPNRSGPGTELREKYVVLLQGGPDFAAVTEVAVVIASTDRGSGGVRPFEVRVGSTHGFDHDTIIDGRWPVTLPKSTVGAGTYLTTLSTDVMWQVSRAIAAGLQMRPPQGIPPRP